MKIDSEKFDTVIIGGGPGGYTAGIRVAQLGGKACIIEKKFIGGVCANTGCIPTKVLASTAKVLSSLKKAEKSGIITGSLSYDIERIKTQVEKAVKKSVTGMEKVLAGNGVSIIKGFARIAEAGKVIVYDDEEKTKIIHTLNTRNIIIATGAKPIKPKSLPGSKNVFTSEDIFALNDIPKNLAIVGGGYIGLEFAYIFNSLGANVHLIEKLPRILATEDREISEETRRLMKRDGIDVLVDTIIKDIQEEEDILCIKAVNKNSPAEVIEINVDKILLAVGREPNFNDEELGKLGIAHDKNGINTDSFMRTNVESIYAVGDVNGKYLLAHVAIFEGIVAAENIMGEKNKMDYSKVPACVFTIPEIASVGKREGKIGKFPFMANGKASTMGEVDGFVKVYVDDGKLAGVSIIGPQASTLIAAAQVLLGKDTGEIRKIVVAHPTLSEAIFEAILAAEKRAINLLNQKEAR